MLGSVLTARKRVGGGAAFDLELPVTGPPGVQGEDAGGRGRAAPAHGLDRGVQRGQPVNASHLHDLRHDRVGHDGAGLLRGPRER